MLAMELTRTSSNKSQGRIRISCGSNDCGSSWWIISLSMTWMAISILLLPGRDAYESHRFLLESNPLLESAYRTASWTSVYQETPSPQSANPDTISCDSVQRYIDNGHWPDPNQGVFYVRRVEDPPNFLVSVHSQSYDRLRFSTIYSKGRYYERNVIERFHRILDRAPKNSIVLDVGGNIGYYTLLSAGLGQVVHTFEINPANLIRMCESLSLNRWADNGRVHIYHRAVSDQTGQTANVVIPSSNPGAAHALAANDGGIQSNQTTIHSSSATTITLDDLAYGQGWLKPVVSGVSIPLLKIDVEGAEPLVVAGAKALLRSGIVQNILTVFRNPSHPQSREAFRVLLEAGYMIVRDDAGKIERLDKLATEAYLKDLETQWIRKRMVYIDLWFQLDEREEMKLAAA